MILLLTRMKNNFFHMEVYILALIMTLTYKVGREKFRAL